MRYNLCKAAFDQAGHHNVRERSGKPHIGQQVLVREHPLSKGPVGFTAKLAPKYGIPWIILALKSPVIVEYHCPGDKTIGTAHIRDLKSYYAPIVSFQAEEIISNPKQ